MKRNLLFYGTTDYGEELSYSDIIILSINFDINLNTKEINFNNLSIN